MTQTQTNTVTEKIKDYRKQGLTAVETIRKLNEAGLKTPMGKTWKPWTYNSFVARNVMGKTRAARKNRAKTMAPKLKTTAATQEIETRALIRFVIGLQGLNDAKKIQLIKEFVA